MSSGGVGGLRGKNVTALGTGVMNSGKVKHGKEDNEGDE